jgi:uncharacterized membrane protein (UPF0182 family)
MRRLPTLLLIGVVLLFLLPSSVQYYTDWLWFRELGYEGVFLRTLNAQLMVFAATFTAVFLFLFLNLRIARGSIMRPHITIGTGADGRAIALDTGPLARLALPAAVIVAVGLGVAGARNWMLWLNFANGASFGQTDPLFGFDVSFYVFRLPAWITLQQQALFTSLLALVGCGAYYVLSGSFVIEPRPQAGFWPSIRLLTSARRHLGLLAAVAFLLLAWGTWLERPAMLLTPASVIFGASYADVHARLPIMWITMAVLVVGAALAVLQGFSRRGWPLPLAIALYFGVSVAGGLYAASVQRFSVMPNELNRERPYIVSNIEATRRAYALDRVEEREHSGDAELSAKDIIANAPTIENVRLWDHQPLLQTFAQIQEIRTYYEFKSVDNDRYTIDGKYRQVMLSARELNPDSIPNRSWVNERLMFTHGYGLTLGPVNQVTTEGLPVLMIRDLPPVSTTSLKVDEPSIYFGELSSDYVLVNTKQREFNYPKGDDNETTVYTGSGGVSIGTFWRRLMFALRFADTDILFTNQLTPESRILYNRRIADRVQQLAPFLSYDADPYLVVWGGRLVWIQDAYTTTRNYPYATPTIYQNSRINYIRNSVKIVIDAYNGSMSFYLAEPGDPIAVTLEKIFPGLLKPLDEMPPDLRKHVRYPEDIFAIQAALYQSYHMTNPQVFYNKEDQWQVPAIESERGSVTMQPYYTVMRLPGEQNEEFIQMLPFTPRLKENLAAWMVARSDPGEYGKLLVFQFPKQKFVFGPKLIVGRINQDEVISPQISLWNQQGSRVIWGTLLVIPINESLLYVRPLYLQSSEAKIPELKQVIVAYQGRIEMAETLTRALARIFGSSITGALAPDRLSSSATSVVTTAADEAGAAAAAPDVTLDPTIASLVGEIRQHFDAADKALRAADFATYGEEMKKARDAFDRLERLQRGK